MIHKMTYSKLRHVIREAIISEADDDKKKGGPIDKAKAWEPPDNMVHGSSATNWSQWDEWDAGGEFDMDTFDEADEKGVEEDHHEED